MNGIERGDQCHVNNHVCSFTRLEHTTSENLKSSQLLLNSIKMYSRAFGENAKISTSSLLGLALCLKNLFGNSMTSESPCTGFEPQNYLRDRCKKCFRLRSKHESTEKVGAKKGNTEEGHSPAIASTSSQQLLPATNPNILPSSATEEGHNNLDVAESNRSTALTIAKKEKRRSWRDKNFIINDEGADFEDTADSISLSSYKTANSKGGMSSGKSMESVSSNLDCRSMVTAMSGSLDLNANDEDRAITPTEAVEFFEHDGSKLRMENARLQELINRLKDERQGWIQLKSSIQNKEEWNLVEILEERLAESERQLLACRNEITSLKFTVASDSLCEKLTVENEALKYDIRDLQQELEEMQDQYREEEIDEFRELQRELEQNAKNCRILQFKLRKSERQRDLLQTEKNHIVSKLMGLQAGNDLLNAEQMGQQKIEYLSPTETMKHNALEAAKDSRIKELESELRVAKEVSVRLHNELEAAEDKRYKMEDEIFYYKEKVRELQTQNKWRETRKKADQTKRHSAELSELSLKGDEASKELRDVLERETDLKDQLRFTEEDLKRTQSRLHDVENENEELMQKLIGLTENNNMRNLGGLNKRPPMLRSVSEGNYQIRAALNNKSTTSRAPTTDTIVEGDENQDQQKQHLRRNSTQEENTVNKSSTDSDGSVKLGGKENGQKKIKPDLQVNNAEIEKDLGRLLSTINELKKKNSELQMQLKTNQTNGDVSQNGNREKALTIELRKEQESKKEMSSELTDYKQLIAKSDNNKLIAMATKVEILSNQLAAANERCQVLHKKNIKDSIDGKYADSLKQQCEQLEKQISELKAKETFKVVKPSSDEQNSGYPTTDEIEQCCVLLASVDTQTNRICKLLEKMDMSQKEERRRSLTKDNYATVMVDLASIMTEIKMLSTVLETHKFANNNHPRKKSPHKEVLRSVPSCTKCTDKENNLAACKDEIDFYKKKNKELTNQILQTEDRWTAEIEKQTQEHNCKLKKLEDELEQTKEKLQEQIELAEARGTAVLDKDKSIDQTNSKVYSLNVELEEKRLQIQTLEKEQKILKEWEIKYKKLETIYEREKQKYDTDKAKIKSDTILLKRRTDEAVDELSKLRDGHQRREIMWNEERAKLETEILRLKEQGQQPMENTESAVVVRSIPIRTINYRVTKMSDESSGIPELKLNISNLEKKNEQLEGEVLSLRSIKDQLETELNKNRQVWEREKDSLTHKTRQDEKIRNVELDAAQQKFTSRINVMEQTNKSLHTQLVQTRRERDLHQKSVASYESKLNEERNQLENEKKKYCTLQSKYNEVEKLLAELTTSVEKLTLELALEKDSHKADKKLWSVEKSCFSKRDLSGSLMNDEKSDENRRITEEALSAAEKVQKQHAEYQKFYTKEVARLTSKIKEQSYGLMAKENEFKYRAKELTEQIKVLEIDQKNLIKAKEIQTNAKELVQQDQERLTQTVQQMEVQKLTRKYKIASIVEQLTSLTANGRIHHHRHHNEQEVILGCVINQLKAMKEEDGQNSIMTSATSEMEGPDTLSQSSISIRSNPFVPATVAYNRYGQFATMTPKNRSYSTESSTTWDSHLEYTSRSVSPVKKATAYPDPPPSFMLHKDRAVEYDKDGRLHYVPRSVSYDKYGTTNVDGPLFQTASSDSLEHSRTGSAGTNILYKIRREELQRGTNPSVKCIAKAFESMEQKSQKKGFFSIRKSRSVDQDKSKENTQFPLAAESTALNHRNTTSMTAIQEMSSSSNLPRGGRNPFKNMGSKLVDRVRRSLSRSSRPRDESQEKTPIPFMEDHNSIAEEPPISIQQPKIIDKPPPKALPLSSTPVKMRPKVNRPMVEKLTKEYNR